MEIPMEASRLSGLALDWAVARSQLWPVAVLTTPEGAQLHFLNLTKGRCKPSSDWTQGGPLLAVYEVSIVLNHHLRNTRFYLMLDYCAYLSIFS